MKLTAVILAAGAGTRMKSSTPKVMHKIAGQPFLEYSLKAVKDLDVKDIRVVASDELIDDNGYIELESEYGVSTHIQKEKLGTGHAVQVAMEKSIKNPVLILCGDVPLIKSSTIQKMCELYEQEKAKLVCLGFKAKNPFGYGRLVSFHDDIIDIVEEKDASEDQKKITLCNSGIYIVDGEVLAEILPKLKNNNNAGEYYLTSIVNLTNQLGHRCIVHTTEECEVLGVNDKVQQSTVERLMQERMRAQHLKAGVTMIDPNSVFLSADTKIGKDVIIHPNVVIGEGVKIANNAEVLPFSHLSNCFIGEESNVGPFARLRADSEIGKNCKVGNFVEVKASKLDDGVKSSHLAYLGDADIGAGTNIGAGTIFCNYDGYNKHKSTLGKNVFIGSNTSLVSPIKIGEGSIVGAGSVITEDVPKNTLSIARARQTNYEQKADLIKEKKKKTG